MDEHPVIEVPATAVGAAFAVIVVELKVLILLPQYEDVKFVIVIVVVPRFKSDVEKVPVPVLPAIKFIEAIFPVAVVAPLRL